MNNAGKKKFSIGKIIAIICAVAFLAGVIWLTVYFVKLAFANADVNEMKDSYIQEIDTTADQDTTVDDEVDADSENQEDVIEEPDDSELDDTQQDEGPEALPIATNINGYDVPMKVIDFATMKQNENSDIYAWITLPGAGIDYPVLQHSELPDYYLDHNIDGSKGYPGAIYTQMYNSKDWTDANTVLYGHNMKNGTMFGSLHQYKDSSFFEKNPYIYIYTEDGNVKVYEIFAAYEYPDINLVTTYYLLGEQSYADYLANMYSMDGMNNNFNTDIKVGTKDKIITLATCISNKPDMRYLVQGVLRAEGSLQ